MRAFRASLSLVSILRRSRPLHRVRSGMLIAFPWEIGLVRFLWLAKIKNKPVRRYDHPDEGTREIAYSGSFLTHYSPERRVQWTMFLLASIPDCRKDSLLIIGPRYEPEILLAHGLGWKSDGVRGLDTFSYSPFVDVGDMHDLPYSDHAFSSIICGWTLSYSTRPDVAAKEMERVLAPGGYLIVSMQKIGEEYVDLLPGVLHGDQRIQTLAQLDRVFSGLDRVAGFEPQLEPTGDGNTIAAYRKKG